jgi:exopolyphosphatase/guanosine-5'-triphosphate,3'-diphosphate pyrophosphatase
VNGVSQPFPDAVAAVDLGSNSFHMLVARTADGSPIVVDRIREMVQMASGLNRKGKLDDNARERALVCLSRFGQRLRHMPSATVRAVGTNSLRATRDGGAFLRDAEEALGHPIETISGIEEARLIYLGVADSMPDPEQRRLVIDIGGGSTELIVGQGYEPQILESLYMGSISSTREHFADGLLTAKSWKRAVTAAGQELEPVRARIADAGWSEAIGASGTVRAVYGLIQATDEKATGITLPALEQLREQILSAGKIQKLNLAALNPKRQPYIAGGVAILMALFQSLEIEHMRRSDGALREGLLRDLIGRMREQDARDRSVDALAERYHVDWKQVARVECTALKMLSMVAGEWNLKALHLRQQLSWAAKLHEIGLDIAHDHYHHHGQYIVAQSDMPGFSRSEQQWLAVLVRAHRRKFPVNELRELPARRRRAAERLAVLLRLAVALHRSRSPNPLPEFKLSVKKTSATLKLPQEWLERNPLTEAVLETEAKFLEAVEFRLKLD